MKTDLRRRIMPTPVTDANENEFAPKENAESRRNLGLGVQGGRDLGEKRINGKVMTVTR